MCRTWLLKPISLLLHFPERTQKRQPTPVDTGRDYVNEETKNEIIQLPTTQRWFRSFVLQSVTIRTEVKDTKWLKEVLKCMGGAGRVLLTLGVIQSFLTFDSLGNCWGVLYCGAVIGFQIYSVIKLSICQNRKD